jgi:hypothetical protein
MKLIRNYDLSDIERLRELGAKPQIIFAESVNVAASGTYTLVDIQKAGFLHKIWMYIDGASLAGSALATLYIELDGVEIYKHTIERWFSGYAAGGIGIRDGYCVIWDNTTCIYSSIRYVGFPFYKRCLIKLTNNDTTNATTLWHLTEFIIFENL